MAGIIGLGKYLFIIPMLVFGILNIMNAKEMATMAPVGGELMIYVTGIALIAASLSVIIGKFDRLACVLLALLLITIALTIHLPNLLNADDPAIQAASMDSFLKDIGLTGGALMASKLARDDAVTG
ncbi:MAG: DoxX family membrane protein [Saprospiraceae bacterium]|nr:DoxX family membrane protein [Saprospiraceae bacterium]MCB9321170.1 DoxX family membrane protein [Lewinellaceae bacterium]